MIRIISFRVVLDRIRKVTEGLIDDEQYGGGGGFRSGRGYMDQIFLSSIYPLPASFIDMNKV